MKEAGNLSGSCSLVSGECIHSFDIVHYNYVVSTKILIYR